MTPDWLDVIMVHPRVMQPPAAHVCNSHCSIRFDRLAAFSLAFATVLSPECVALLAWNCGCMLKASSLLSSGGSNTLSAVRKAVPRVCALIALLSAPALAPLRSVVCSPPELCDAGSGVFHELVAWCERAALRARLSALCTLADDALMAVQSARRLWTAAEAALSQLCTRSSTEYNSVNLSGSWSAQQRLLDVSVELRLLSAPAMIFETLDSHVFRQQAVCAARANAALLSALTRANAAFAAAAASFATASDVLLRARDAQGACKTRIASFVCSHPEFAALDDACSVQEADSRSAPPAHAAIKQDSAPSLTTSSNCDPKARHRASAASAPQTSTAKSADTVPEADALGSRVCDTACDSAMLVPSFAAIAVSSASREQTGDKRARSHSTVRAETSFTL